VELIIPHRTTNYHETRKGGQGPVWAVAPLIINYLINRLTSYPITKCNTRKEEEIVDYLLKINGYQYLNTKQFIRQKQLRKNEKRCNNRSERWAVFTYTGL
jgi:hypothetical protein